MATLIWNSGFEHGAAPSVSGGGLFAVVNGSPAINATAKITGNYGLHIKTTSSATQYVNPPQLASTISVTVARFRVKFIVFPNTSTSLFTICPSGYSDSGIGINTDHKLFVKYAADSGSTVMATALQLDTVYLIDIRITSSGGYITIDWKVDGNAQSQYTYAITDHSWKDHNIGWHTFAGAAIGEAYFDDFAISATSGDYPLAGVGKGLPPADDGTHSPATPDCIYDNAGNLVSGSNKAYVELSDVPISESTNYIKQTTSHTSDYVEVKPSFTDNVSSVNGARAILAYKSSGTQLNNGKTYIYTEDGDYDTIYAGDMSESSVFYKSVQVHNPNGGWDKDAVNALRLRLGYSGDINPVPYWCNLIIEVDYVEQTATPINISDSGVGSDALAGITTKFTMTDAGVGTESILGVFQKWLQESGVGGESLGLKNAFISTDAGVGVDTIASLVKAAIDDNGSGIDSTSLLAKLGIGDSGIGNDILALIRVLLDLADAGTGTEIVNVSEEKIPINISDLGAGTDSMGMKAVIPILESGSGAEIIGLEALIPILESGIGSETIGLKMAFMIPDTGLGTDETLIKLYKSLSDSGYGIEQVFTTSPTKFINDSGQGLDIIIVVGEGGRKPKRLPQRTVIVMPNRR